MFDWTTFVSRKNWLQCESWNVFRFKNNFKKIRFMSRVCGLVSTEANKYWVHSKGKWINNNCLFKTHERNHSIVLLRPNQGCTFLLIKQFDRTSSIWENVQIKWTFLNLFRRMYWFFICSLRPRFETIFLFYIVYPSLTDFLCK